MEPFRIAAQLLPIVDAYPAANAIREAAAHGGDQARRALARLWLSEGIPYAFRECPAIYEAVRSWLGVMLSVDPKMISLTGSARLGFALAPRKFGKLFDHSSDLDILVISERLFEVLSDEFRHWSLDFEQGRVVPDNQREQLFWRDNLSRGHILLQRGFMDQKLIPNRLRYPETKKISQGMWLLVEKLKLTPQAPRPKKATIRCYSSWGKFVNQVSMSLS